MRAVLKEGPGPGCRLVVDRAEPSLRDGEVRVAVAFASVCGTDAAFHASGDAGGDLSMTFPRTMGHEVSGTVVELGPGPRTGPRGDLLRVGDRVAVETHIQCGSCWFCRAGHGHNCARMRILGIDVDGAFAERLVVPASTCWTVPEAVGPAAAAMLESAGSAVHGLLRSGVPLPGAAVLVTGAGAVGLAAAQVAAALGARQVVVVEPVPTRRATANAYGAQVAADGDGARELMDHDARERGGFDLAVECSGALPALQTAVRAVRREATVVSVGLVKTELPLSVTGELITRGTTLRGSWGRSLWDTWRVLTDLVASGRVDLEGLVTHRLPLSGFTQALDLMRQGSGKVLLDPALPDAKALPDAQANPDRTG